MYRKVIVLIALALVFVFPAGLVMADLTEGLVGYWPLDGDAKDVSGNGHHGVINGNVTPTADRFGTADSAMNFPGTTADYIDLGQPPMLLIKGAMTVAAWVRADTLTQNGRVIAKQGPSSGRSWSIQLESAGDFARFDVGINPTDRVRADSEPLSFGPDEWFHMAGVFRPGEAVELYIDGELAKSEPTTITTQWIENGLPINIGRRPSPGTPWQGDIDEAQMYNIALSPDEVQNVMGGTLLSFPRARGPDPEDGALHADTWVTLSWSPGDSAVSHDVYIGDDFDDVENATRDSDLFRGNQITTFYVAGFPGFAYPEGLVPGTTYYWRIDEVNDADPNSPWKGDVWSFSIPPKTAYNPDPADGAGIAETTVTLTWTAGFGAKLHTVYFADDFDTVADATVGEPLGTTTYNPGPLEAEKVYYWRVDEFDGLGTYTGDVWAFATPGAVGNPQPANGAVDVAMATVLSWTPAANAASHEVYLGLDKNAVRSADATSPEYKGSVALGAESYDPGLLDPETVYYWRVDGVYGGNPVKGPVWSFTVGDYLLVDDFESYTDDDAAGEAIWQTWVDGFGIADNGAQAGNLMPPYCEQTIVHGGAQSMPLFYTNEAGVTNSEALLTLTAPRDWTVAGVADLSLWFRGDSANAADPLYVAISNAADGPAVVAHEDPAAATIGIWTEWRIPLQAFAEQGINLTNVDKIAIGLGTKAGVPAVGGSGTTYFDDIRLYRPRAAP